MNCHPSVKIKTTTRARSPVKRSNAVACCSGQFCNAVTCFTHHAVTCFAHHLIACQCGCEASRQGSRCPGSNLITLSTHFQNFLMTAATSLAPGNCLGWPPTNGSGNRPRRTIVRLSSHRRFNAQGAQSAPATGALKDHERAGDAQKNPGDEQSRRVDQRTRDDKGDAAQVDNDAAHQARLPTALVNVAGQLHRSLRAVGWLVKTPGEGGARVPLRVPARRRR